MHDNLADFAFFGDTRVADVRAEIDLANADKLEAVLSGEKTTRDSEENFVLSLSDCPYIDSSGIRVLIRLSNSFGSQFAVVASPGCHARRVIDVTGLAKAMGVFDSLEPALASFEMGAPAGAHT